MLTDDYATRITNGMVSTLLKLIFNIELGKNEATAFNDTEIESRYQELIQWIDSGKINDAENRLLEELEPGNMEYYKMSLMFYYYMNEKENSFLEEHDFSRNEITDGLKNVSEIYGYESMAEALLGKSME